MRITSWLSIDLERWQTWFGDVHLPRDPAVLAIVDLA